jgi:hypothetical protein
MSSAASFAAQTPLAGLPRGFDVGADRGEPGTRFGSPAALAVRFLRRAPGPGGPCLWSKNTEGREVIIDAAIDLQVGYVDRVTGIHPIFFPLMA